MLANEIEHYPPIDVARRAARGDVKIGKVNLAHGSSRFRGFVRIANYIRPGWPLSIVFLNSSSLGSANC